MASKSNVTDQQIIEAYNDHSKPVNWYCIKLGISQSTFDRKVRKIYSGRQGYLLKKRPHSCLGKVSNSPVSNSPFIEELGENPPPLNPEIMLNDTYEEEIQTKRLKEEIRNLKSQLNEAQKRAVTSSHLIEIIHGSEITFRKQANWLSPAKEWTSTTGIPVLLMSDWHFDEVVDPAQISFFNEYDPLIAEKRIKHTFQKSQDIFLNFTKNPKYEGVVIAFLGDMLSGNIHEELKETNQLGVFPAMMKLQDILCQGIAEYADIFGKVFVPCIVGNHGRLSRKPRNKNKVYDNLEWILYQQMARVFRDDPRVTFQIPEGPDARFTLYNSIILATHGDQFRGGTGISGIFTPLMLGYFRKQKRRPFDMMWCGHFHQYVHTSNLVVNGSGKGYDEFANNKNFDFERPQQAAFIFHRHNGMVLRTPILCDAYPGGRTEDEPTNTITFEGKEY